MRILITGNAGYVGPVLTRRLVAQRGRYTVAGMDSGYFADCLTGPDLKHAQCETQHWDDTRDTDRNLAGFDAVVHLAGISNDPMGHTFAQATKDVGVSAVRIAAAAKRAGVRRFVFASSCSLYGAATGAPKAESDELNPLTAYAISKRDAETGLAALADDSFRVVNLRFATACGASPRLRLDLVLNDFVASAACTGTITVLSDGSPWRPLIDVEDMARAFEWAATHSPEAACTTVNVGGLNYQVADLAEAVARRIPGTAVSINRNAAPDKRSYRVDFSRFQRLAPDAQPVRSLEDSIDAIHEQVRNLSGLTADFRSNPQFIRLKALERLVGLGKLDRDLRWARERADVAGD